MLQSKRGENRNLAHLPCAGITLTRFNGYYLSRTDPKDRESTPRTLPRTEAGCCKCNTEFYNL